MDTVVTPIESADDPAAEQAYQVNVAAQAADVPDLPPNSWYAFVGTLAHPWPHRPTRHLLARVDGAPAGYLQLGLPDLDNTENAFVEVSVHPAYRRRGVGRVLYERAVAIARQEGRKRLMGDTVAALPGGVSRDGAGAAFAQAVGASAVLTEVRRRLDLTTVDDAALDEPLAQAWRRADGYSVVRWRDEVPDEYVADVAYLEGRMNIDAPMGDLAMEREQIDADRIRAVEAATRARRRRRYDAGVRHDATGRLVAWTTLAMEYNVPDHAWQGTTIVEPGHRGHRLGLIVKIENLRYAREHEPALRDIDTWNAAANAHMIAINEQVGFRPVDSLINWQQDL